MCSKIDHLNSDATRRQGLTQARMTVDTSDTSMHDSLHTDMDVCRLPLRAD
jgi:hypothetical protein